MAREVVVFPTAHVFEAEGKQVDEGRPEFVREAPAGGSVHLTPGAEVVWARDSGWAQLGIMIPKANFAALAKMAEETDLSGAEGSPTLSVFVDMNRADVNRMIRLLRRARNSAFGEDE